MKTRRALLVFTKVPEPGKVMTRLAQHIGDEKSAALQRQLINSTLEQCSDSTWDTQLWCAPDIDHPYFHRLREKNNLTLHRQEGEDLGQRMYYALNEALEGYHQVALIGTDCPVLNRSHIAQVFSILDQGKTVVLTPAEDGGYVLIAARDNSPDLFENVSWGSQAVLSETRERLRKLSWEWSETDALWDVDRAEDLKRYMAHKAARPGRIRD